MNDEQIVDLYWARQESAITETAIKYGKYCHSIACRVLQSNEDAEESVNDTYLHTWNALPPHRPRCLSTFLGKITRRVSIDRWRSKTADKRGGGETTLALEELSECIADSSNVEQNVEQRELTRLINNFLTCLPDTERDVFVSRYWFMASVKEIAVKFDFTEAKTKTMLFRTRQKLGLYLRTEGY